MLRDIPKSVIEAVKAINQKSNEKFLEQKQQEAERLAVIREGNKPHTVPKTAKEKSLAALAEPKDKITHADVMVGRGVKKEEVEEIEEAAKWRQGYRASSHPAGYKHTSGEVGPLGGTYDTQTDYGDEKKVPVQKHRDYADPLVSRGNTKLSTTGKPLLPKNAQKNLKTAIQQSKGKHGPVNPLPEEVEEIEEADELAMRYKFSFNKTPAGKAREVARNREHLKWQMKTQKDMGGLAGPKKGQLPEEVEQTDEAMSHQAATTMKHVKGATTGEKAAAKNIKPGIAGYRDRIAMMQSAKARGGLKNEEVESVEEEAAQVDEKYIGFKKLAAAKSPALAAWIGRKKYGKAKFQAAAAAGKKLKEQAQETEQLLSAAELELLDKIADSVMTEEEKPVHPSALHVSHVGGGKYKVHAVGKNFADGIKVGEHVSDSELDDFKDMGGKIKNIK